jgi:MoaA/NifB/PqqE/SkfB family radical SAM enzyme
MKKPEILAPAGNFEKLKVAVAFGADAVYMAGTSFGMRSAAGNFTAEELPEAIKYCHDRGVKAYVTVNTMPRTNEYKRLAEHLKLLEKAGQISELRRQVPFELIPAQYETIERYGIRGQRLKDGKRCIEKSVVYNADFVYTENGKTVVEDTKSEATKTKDYILKRKMMLFFHGIKIREV